MNRRLFFIPLLGAIIGASSPGPKPQAKCYLYVREFDIWIPIERPQIKRDMAIWIEDDGVYLVDRGAERKPDGRWTFLVDHRMDPDSGEWVPLMNDEDGNWTAGIPAGAKVIILLVAVAVAIVVYQITGTRLW